MNDIDDIKQFKTFLEENAFEEPSIDLRKINRGGCSFNFRATTKTSSFLIKVLPAENSVGNVRLHKILQTLKEYPDFSTAHLAENNQQLLFYQDYQVIITDFICGTKLSFRKLTPEKIKPVVENYRRFMQIPFHKYDFVLPQHLPENIYNENKARILNFGLVTGKNYQKMINFLFDFNENVYRLTPHLQKPTSVIHGDASLNNMIFTDDGKAFFLDLDLIRFGYAAEDAAELILSALLPHYVFTSPLHRLSELKQAVDAYINFTSDEWKYGICLHFMHFLSRRLRGGKLFKSYRKDWLVKHYLQKFGSIMDTVR